MTAENVYQTAFCVHASRYMRTKQRFSVHDFAGEGRP